MPATKLEFLVINKAGIGLPHVFQLLAQDALIMHTDSTGRVFQCCSYLSPSVPDQTAHTTHKDTQHTHTKAHTDLPGRQLRTHREHDRLHIGAGARDAARQQSRARDAVDAGCQRQDLRAFVCWCVFGVCVWCVQSCLACCTPGRFRGRVPVSAKTCAQSCAWGTAS